MILPAILALFAAASNAFASVLQRHEARSAPREESFRPALILDLGRRPLWWLGIVGVMAGAVFQGAALLTGPLAVVQPLMMIELPLTLLLAALVFRRRLGGRSIAGTAGVTFGVMALLVAVDPSGGGSGVDPVRWTLALPSVVAAVALLVGLGQAVEGAARAASLGASAAVAFALTAALMKDATGRLEVSAAAFFTSWQLYATVAAGICAMFLLQNAYQAGTIVAAQPAITVGDALVSLVLGVVLFDEDLRLGAWTLLALVGLAMIIAGALELSRSPLMSQVASRSDLRPTT
ncbi:DMT family transporter [Actinopolymorpha alba]|uniref:DMT family transporter n=1 Tax=Actinopolymorpha alba TaxID=533267 RepID=UPI00037992A0|nr:DMT family transporter [Actinopolymorpha alba]